jgi:hypothetical protein
MIPHGLAITQLAMYAAACWSLYSKPPSKEIYSIFSQNNILGGEHMICYFLRKCFEILYASIMKDGCISDSLIILRSPTAKSLCLPAYFFLQKFKDLFRAMLAIPFPFLCYLYLESSLVPVYRCLNCFDFILVWLWDLFY